MRGLFKLPITHYPLTMHTSTELLRRIVPAVLLLFFSVAVQAAEKSSSYTAALESISVEQLKGYVDYLADDELEGREAGKRGGRTAGEYLRDRLEKLELQGAGADGTFFQPFGQNFRNVLAILPGSDEKLKDQFVVVNAHYDHVGYGTWRNSRGPVGQIHNGADDNASGTAALLELAEAFSMLPVSPRRSILFAFWDAEEKGLLGSKHWVARPTVPIENVVIEINLDMIGRLRNEKLKIFGTRTGYGWRRLISFQNTEEALKLDFRWTLLPNSDHYPFFKRNIPALLLHTGLHDQYHSPRDDAELINNPGIRRVSRLLFAMVYELADGEQVPGFRKAARYETKTGRWLLALFTPRLPRRLGAHWDPKESAADGLRLTHIDVGSAAEKANLRNGDRIVEFAGRKIHGGEELRAAVLSAENPAKAIVRRAGQNEPLTVTVHLAGKPLRMGIAWRIDDAEPGTVILTYVAPDSPADRAGLHAGDRIYQTAGEDFSDDRQFARMIETLPKPLELLVERDGRLRTVMIHIETKPLDRAA